MQDIIPLREHHDTRSQTESEVYQNAPVSHVRGSRTALILTTVIILIGAGTYWFAWRPYNIRKQCAQLAYNSINRPGFSFEAGITTGNYDSIYQYCLSTKGL